MVRVKHRYGGTGPLRWSRSEWLALMVQIGGRAYGVHITFPLPEITLIVGCRVVERGPAGEVSTLAGGFHCILLSVWQLRALIWPYADRRLEGRRRDDP